MFNTGRVLYEGLVEHGYLETTIVALWSDHGYHLGETNSWFVRTRLSCRQWYCYHGDGGGDGGGGGSGGGVDFGDDCRRVCLFVTCIPFLLAYNTSAADDAKCGITIPYNPTIIPIFQVQADQL